MAIEAKPPVQWNKGEAALHILRQEFGNDWADKVKVIFAGDDTTDEDAMKVYVFASNSCKTKLKSIRNSFCRH